MMQGVKSMIRIKGRSAEAICFTGSMDDAARRDLLRLCDHELLADRHIRVMPDVHSNGNGTLTGFTMYHKEPVILALEFGSGCGVSCAFLEDSGADLALLDEVCHEIPAGRDVYLEPPFEYDLSGLRCFRAITALYDPLNALGSLGSGNHFIELDSDDDGRLYLTVHNGLCSLSRIVRDWYYRRTLRKCGMTEDSARLEDSCIYGQDMDDYLHDMQILEDAGRTNRRYITEHIAGRMGWRITDLIDTCHHSTDKEDGIIRHGAVSARKGRRLVIPVNAAEGCILATGKGNGEWNLSAPHGGGRVLSRERARDRISMDKYRDSMQAVYTSTVSMDNIDEAPDAFRSLSCICSEIQDTASIDRVLHPLFNYRG